MAKFLRNLGNVIILIIILCIACRILEFIKRLITRENYYENTVDVAKMIDLNRKSRRAFLKSYKEDKQSLDLSQLDTSKLVQSYPDIPLDRINAV